MMRKEILVTRTFIQTREFSKNWDKLELTDKDLRRLELEILMNPKVGTIIQGTGKLRKMRFAFENRGKRGSARVCYVDFAVHKTIYLITVYTKNEKENLSKAQCNEIGKAIDILERSFDEQKGAGYE